MAFGKKKAKNNYDYAEIYRQVRTNIEFASVEKEIRVIGITSASPNEGKSTVSANLASVYAAKNAKTLIIDCDLRKPSVQKHFTVSNKVGLSNLLKDYNTLTTPIISSPYIQKATSLLGNDEVYVLASGAKVYNPAEVLASDRFKRVLAQLKEEFDVIIIDTPPILSVSDAMYIGDVVDGMLFVVSGKSTHKNNAKQAITQLKRNKINILGVVMSQVERENLNYLGYYYSYGE